MAACAPPARTTDSGDGRDDAPAPDAPDAPVVSAPEVESVTATEGEEMEAAPEAGASDTQIVSDPEVEGVTVTEGDMIFKNDDSQGIAGSTTSGYTRWPKGVIPYQIEAGMPHPERVTQAAAQWTSKTGIRWVRRTNEVDYVYFKNGIGCWSYLGKVRGRQDISLQYTKKAACDVAATAHEMGHAIGLAHEHSRADRDSYVKILWDNIEPSQKYNFEKINFQSIGTYDINSLMQYDSLAFSKNGRPTIVRKFLDLRIPRRTRISTKDAAGVRELYAGELP